MCLIGTIAWIAIVALASVVPTARVLLLQLFLFVQSSGEVTSAARTIFIVVVFHAIILANLDGLPINKLVAAIYVFSLEIDVCIPRFNASSKLLSQRVVVVPVLMLETLFVAMMILGGLDNERQGLLEVAEGLVDFSFRICLLLRLVLELEKLSSLGTVDRKDLVSIPNIVRAFISIPREKIDTKVVIMNG